MIVPTKSHYENMPTQYAAIFRCVCVLGGGAVKIDKFQ